MPGTVADLLCFGSCLLSIPHLRRGVTTLLSLASRGTSPTSYRVRPASKFWSSAMAYRNRVKQREKMKGR